MSKENERLYRDTIGSRTLTGSVSTFMAGLSRRIRSLRNDPAGLDDLATELDGQQLEIAAMITANTEHDRALDGPHELNAVSESMSRSDPAYAKQLSQLPNEGYQNQQNQQGQGYQGQGQQNQSYRVGAQPVLRLVNETEAAYNLRVEAARPKTYEDIRVAVANRKVQSRAQYEAMLPLSIRTGETDTEFANRQIEAQRIRSGMAAGTIPATYPAGHSAMTPGSYPAGYYGAHQLVQAGGESDAAFARRKAEAVQYAQTYSRDNPQVGYPGQPGYEHQNPGRGHGLGQLPGESEEAFSARRLQAQQSGQTGQLGSVGSPYPEATSLPLTQLPGESAAAFANRNSAEAQRNYPTGQYGQPGQYGQGQYGQGQPGQPGQYGQGQYGQDQGQPGQYGQGQDRPAAASQQPGQVGHGGPSGFEASGSGEQRATSQPGAHQPYPTEAQRAGQPGSEGGQPKDMKDASKSEKK